MNVGNKILILFIIQIQRPYLHIFSFVTKNKQICKYVYIYIDPKLLLLEFLKRIFKTILKQSFPSLVRLVLVVK